MVIGQEAQARLAGSTAALSEGPRDRCQKPWTYAGKTDVIRHCVNIAFLGNAGNHYPEFQERYRGYAAALQEAGLQANPTLQADGLSSEADGRAAAALLLQRRLPFDSVVAASDLLAIGAMRYLQERGWQVPQQVAFVGFDDIPAASMASPPLTTVVQDTRRAGEVLVDTLLRLVGGEPAVGTVLPTQLVVRASCGS